MRLLFALLLLIFAPVLATSQQAQLTYALRYTAPGSERVRVTMTFRDAQAAPLTLVMPEQVIAYFGGAPFPHYTILIELLRPVSPEHRSGFSMEHLDSSTYYLGMDRGITSKSTAEQRDRERFNFAHHIAHAWVPKRAYGEGYFPFTGSWPRLSTQSG